MRLKIFTDGGARGNPGPAAVGVVIKNEKDEVIDKFGKFIGVETNNVAEYTAVIEALTTIKNYELGIMNQGLEGIDFYLDSELIVGQLTGVFKTKNPKLRELLFKIRELEAEVGGNVSYKAIRREENKIADSLVNKALDNAVNRI